MRTVAIAKQKGGCGKTTTSVNLAAALALSGKRTLLVDLDPQAHATIGLGQNPEGLERTVYNLLTETRFSVATTAVETRVERLSLLPSNVLLSGIEFELAPLENREYVLHERLDEASDNYDICLIDCSPSLSLLTLNALVASDELIIPVQAHYYALEGLKLLLETVDIVKKRFNQNLQILGILLTFVESRTRLSR